MKHKSSEREERKRKHTESGQDRYTFTQSKKK